MKIKKIQVKCIQPLYSKIDRNTPGSRCWDGETISKLGNNKHEQKSQETQRYVYVENRINQASAAAAFLEAGFAAFDAGFADFDVDFVAFESVLALVAFALVALGAAAAFATVF